MNLYTAQGGIFLIFLIVGILGFVLFAVLRGKGARVTLAVGIIGFVVAGLAVVAAALTPVGTGAIVPPATNEMVNTIEASTPALISGTTWNSVTSVLTVNMLYNTTSHAFCTATSFVATHDCGHAGTNKNYVLLPLNLIRTDAVNKTASFPITIAQVPTLQSLGASPSTYSQVGYKAATGTTPGQWQLFWSVGTTANQKPTVSAPSQSTNVQTNGIAVTAFGNKVTVLHISLAGSNSTSAPQTFANAIQNYTAYPLILTLGNSNPATVTINFILIGYTT